MPGDFTDYYDLAQVFLFLYVYIRNAYKYKYNIFFYVNIYID